MQNLITKYISESQTPTFSKFCKTYEPEIQSLSTDLRFSSALSLQHKWEDKFRSSMEIERPEIDTDKRSSTANAVLTRVHALITSQRVAAHQILVASTEKVGEAAFTAAGLIPLQPGPSGAATPTSLKSMLDQKLTDKKTKYQPAQERENTEGANMSVTLHDIAQQLLQQQNNTKEELEFCKLCLSSTVSFISPKIHSMFKSLLPEHLYLEAKMASEAKKVSLVCPPEIATLANKIVEGLKPFENDRDTRNCVLYLDKAKYEELDKTSTNYQLLCITEKVAIDVLKKSGKVRESFWVRKFIEVVEVLLIDTDFVVSDGEGVCNDTRAASSGSVFGRRVDLLVSVSEGGTTINLASFEAKKDDAVVSSQLHQQIKNHRINAAILNRANCLLGTTDHNCIYMDIVGSNGYFVQLSRKDNYLICQPLANFRMATNLIEIDSISNFLIELYAWKLFIVNQSIELKKSMNNRKRKFSLIETFSDSNKQPSASIDPINIYHSP